MHGESTVSRDSDDEFPDAESIQALLQCIPAAAYVCDAQLRVRVCNDAASRLWGRAPERAEAVRRLFAGFRFYDSDGRPVALDETALTRADVGEVLRRESELTFESPAGTRARFVVRSHPWTRGPSSPGVMWMLEEVPSSGDPIDAERFLASIVTSSDDAIVSKDLNGQIQSWNAGAERLFGYSADEMIGQPITSIIPQDLLEEEHSILERLRLGERMTPFETWRVDKQGRRKPISLSASPIRDAAGRIVGAATVARDISAHKAAAAELMELQHVQSQQLADLLRLQQMSLHFSATLDLEQILREALQTACALSDTSHGLLTLYDSQRDRLSIGASLGFERKFLQALEKQEAAVGACGRCLSERRRVIVEDIADDSTFDGIRQPAIEAGIRAVHSTPLVTRAGKLVGVLSLAFPQRHRPSDREIRLLDICARQAVDYIENARLYHELREADHRKDEFLAVLAHELRNPLAPLKNALEIMRLTNDAGSSTDELRSIMDTQVQHLVRLVDDLLDVSRYTRGKIELRRENVRLADVVKAAVDTSRPHFDAAGHRLDVDLPDEPIRLQVDPVRIAQVISNLLINASKFTPSPGRIRVWARSAGAETVIRVEDNGQGIAPDTLPRIFDMFAQVENIRAQGQGGLGIGLAMSRALVELHGGTIEASSPGLGHGACFTVRLPPSATSSAGAGENADSSGGGMLPRRRIVVVDDTRVAAYTLGRLLETINQEVFVAYDARTALELVRERRPQIVISDIAMPEMDGFELASRIRSLRDSQAIKLVALTGYGQDSDRERTRAAGFDSHLVKPVGIGALQKLLSALSDVDG